MNRKAMQLILFLTTARLDIFEDIDNANTDINNGNIQNALNTLSNVYNKYHDKVLAQKAFFSLLYKAGQYNRIVDNINGNKNIKRDLNGKIVDLEISDIFEKAKSNKSLMKELHKHCDYLVQESPFSKVILRVACEKMLKKRDFLKCKEYVDQAITYFPDDQKMLKMKYHLQICKGELEEGIKGFKKFDKTPLTEKLGKFYNDYKSIDQSFKNGINDEKKNGRFHDNLFEVLFRRLNIILNEINTLMANDKNQPSLFYHFRFLILNEIVMIGIKLGKKGLSQKAKDAMKIKNTDTEKYNYFYSLILEEKIETLEKELPSAIFNKISIKNTLEARLAVMKEAKRKKLEEEKLKKERKEEEQRQKEKQRKQNEERRGYNHMGGSQKGEDYKGYYKALGLTKDCTKKQILKNYRKLVKKNNPDKFKGKDEKKYKELSEEMMKINKAKDVLIDDDSRRKYDSGTLDMENNMGGGYEGHDFNDIFSQFFGGGFFETSGGYSGGGGGQRRYYYSRTYG